LDFAIVDQESTHEGRTRFTGLARHHLHDAHTQPVQTFQPELNDPQTQVLELLDIPTSLYTQTP